MPKPSQPSGDAAPGANRFLLQLWLATVLSAAVLAVLAALVWHAVPPMTFSADDGHLPDAAGSPPASIIDMRDFAVPSGYFYAEQPAKNLAYETGCLVTPFIVVLGWFISRRLVHRLSDAILPVALRVAVGISWLLFLWCLSALVWCPHPPLEGMPPDWLLCKWFFVRHVFFTWSRLFCLGLGAGFVLLLFRCGPLRRKRSLVLLALLVLWGLLVPSDFYTPSQIDDTWRFTIHFNAATHGLAQVINGHHFLVHFPNQYGGYIEFLGPVLALLPRRVETLLLPFPILHAVAVLAFLLTARLVIRDVRLFFITGLALLGLQFTLHSIDHSYAYGPIRTVFPALGLLAATRYFLRPGALNYGAASCLAAVAPLWNLDTGDVLWLSWLATLVLVSFGAGKPFQAFRHLAIQTGLLVASVSAFFLYLKIVAGSWADPRMLFAYQMLFAQSGFCCLRLLVPDIWMAILTIYLTGLVAVFHFQLNRTATPVTHVVLLLSLLGTGLFSYFMGRSAESNLAAVSYPAILLIAILLDQTRLMVRLGRLPRLTWALLMPAGLMAGWWALVLTLALPDLLAISGNVVKTWRVDGGTPFLADAAFVQQSVSPGDKVFMLSRQSSFFYYLSDTVCPIAIPGPGELIWSGDTNLLTAALASARFPKLIVDRNFFQPGLLDDDVYRRIREAIAQHYRAVAVSPSGRVTLSVPSDAGTGAGN